MTASTTLLLLRHASAESARPGQHDLDRRLTSHGRDEARGVGTFLAGLGLAVGHVLCSPAERTRETLDLLTQSAGRPVGAVGYESRLYLAGVDDLLDLVDGLGASTVLVVGHAPAVPEAVHVLAGGASSPALATVARRYPPATLARLTLTGGGVGRGPADLVGVRIPDGSDGQYFG